MPNINLNSPAPAFTGEFRHKVEGRNRITIPAKWRFEEEVELFMIPKTLKKCISVMTRAEVERITAEADTMEPEDRSNFLDTFGRHLRQATLDKAGRISIPDDLCKLFGIAGEVFLSGSLATFNIWNVADFEANEAPEKARKESLMRRLGI
ncbi:MAG: transcriptional regulator MraZ [Chthoniobacter sp.]|jgi:MraZ protein|nr:transcriptional regulator MraZ [Chthoniobacter sp.]